MTTKVPNLQWLWLRALYEVLHEVQVIKIQFYYCTDEILLSVLKYMQKTPRNHTMNKKKSDFEEQISKFQN